MKKFFKLVLICMFMSAAVAAVKLPADGLTADSAFSGTSAKAAVVVEVNSGRVLFSKNPHQQLPIASTTKILTALTVLEHCSSDTVVTIPKKAVGIEGSSIYLVEGEHLTVKELLYGLMLRSGNDAATALALHCGGSVEAFAEMMNETAKNLGCENSNFVNPHGLHDDGHYCSAMDLAKISAHAMRNSEFSEIAGTKTIKISNEKYDYPRVLINKNKLLNNLENATGIKTGYTKKAGRCFVGSSKTDDGLQLVTVLLNCGPMFEDCESMLRHYSGLYELKNITALVALPDNISVDKGKAAEAKIQYENSFYYPVLRDGSEDSMFDITVELKEYLKAPVKKGDIAGQINISKDNQLIFSTKIVSITNVERKGIDIWDFLFPSESSINETEQIYGGLRCCKPQSV